MVDKEKTILFSPLMLIIRLYNKNDKIAYII